MFYGVCILFEPTRNNIKFVPFIDSLRLKGLDCDLVLCSTNNKLYLYYNIMLCMRCDGSQRVEEEFPLVTIKRTDED